MAMTQVLFEFKPGPDGGWTVFHDIATSIVRASKEGLTPAYRQAYMQAMAPIMKQHEAKGRSETQADCAVCNQQPKRQVLMTPMSYLHLETPRVSVLVTPVCGAQLCDDMGKAMVSELVNDTMAVIKENPLPGSAKDGFGFKPPSKNAHCPCGSSRKYKKCCGRANSMDDVD